MPRMALYLLLIFLSVPIKEGLEDWDCPESLSIEGMVAALDYIKKHGTLPVSDIILSVKANLTAPASFHVKGEPKRGR